VRRSAEKQAAMLELYPNDNSRNLGYRQGGLIKYGSIKILADPLHIFLRTFEIIFAATVSMIISSTSTRQVGFDIITRHIQEVCGVEHFHFYAAKDPSKGNTLHFLRSYWSNVFPCQV